MIVDLRTQGCPWKVVPNPDPLYREPLFAGRDTIVTEAAAGGLRPWPIVTS